MVTFGVRAVCTYIISLLYRSLSPADIVLKIEGGCVSLFIGKGRWVGGGTEVRRSPNVFVTVYFGCGQSRYGREMADFRQFAGVASDDCVIRSMYLHFLAFLAVGASQTIGRNADSPVASDILRPPITPKT